MNESKACGEQNLREQQKERESKERKNDCLESLVAEREINIHLDLSEVELKEKGKKKRKRSCRAGWWSSLNVV